MTETFIVRQIIPGVFSKLFFIICSLTSLYFTLQGYYFFILFSLITTILPFSYKAVDFNLKTKIYRNYLSIAGFKIGEIRPLNDIVYLFAKDTTFLSTGEYSSDQVDLYEVSLSCSGQTKIELLYTDNKNEVVQVIKKAAVRFNCPTKDFTKEKLLKIDQK